MNLDIVREIYKANEAIDDAFLDMTKENRGKTSRTILKSVRDLNDNLALLVWNDINPGKEMGLNKVASKMQGKYRFFAQFDSFLRKSVSHFTPSVDGSERLLLKYYKYLLQLKKTAFELYEIDILTNIDKFIDDTDEQTYEYYSKVVEQIEINKSKRYDLQSDNYYIHTIKPFYINHKIYYEVTLEPATDKFNKFHRITAFTNYDIFNNYCVSLSFIDTNIDIFNTKYPIKIINSWGVSIRPCEIVNFADLIGMNIRTARNNYDYKALMHILTQTHYSLVDIIDFNERKYKKVIEYINKGVKTKESSIVKLLDECRYITRTNKVGKNIIRYLLVHMNNKVIKDQRPNIYFPNTYSNYNMSTKCVPFDKNPYAFNPKSHVSNLYDLFQCIDVSKHTDELLKRYIDVYTYNNNLLYIPFGELEMFGTEKDIIELTNSYNSNLYSGFKPGSEIGIYKDNLYINENESDIIEIVEMIKELTTKGSKLYEKFDESNIEYLEQLSNEERLDDPIKKKILEGIFTISSIHVIYGAAGTGKTRLLNNINSLIYDANIIYLAKTHPAVENLRKKIINKNENINFTTIDKFIKKIEYEYNDYDLVVVDECSTVKNKEILEILKRKKHAALILVGDIYQIESIGFGNWFSLIKNILPNYCCHELKTSYRSNDKLLLSLWDEVRTMSNDNISLEYMVRKDYSHKIDEDIFTPKDDDEIILCLNYNGLYGLNNINKLLQLNNPEKCVSIGIWDFKKGDPILFNDSERFMCLHNNLKGKIIDIYNQDDSVYFIVEVETILNERDINNEYGLTYFGVENNKTKVGFMVNRRKPYSSDLEETTNEHVIPFQVAYAVSIHKSQGLEFNSVKIVIADESEERISHSIFYTAITRTRKNLTIYWSPEVCNRVLNRIRPNDNKRDYNLMKTKGII